jgi:hypothetical protein
MTTRSFRPSRRRRSPVPDVDALVREATEAARARAQGYRERSLALHGWICAKCAREFDASNLHLLTVHHKDGNNRNNPPDGTTGRTSAWTATRTSTAEPPRGLPLGRRPAEAVNAETSPGAAASVR